MTMAQFMIPLLEVTIPPQEKGEIEVEVETIVTARVVSAYQLIEEQERSCRWILNPQFISCFNFPDDFQKITLWRKHDGKFKLEVEYETCDTDAKGNKVPGSEFMCGELLEVSAVREVQSFPSVEEGQ